VSGHRSEIREIDRTLQSANLKGRDTSEDNIKTEPK
jgi:hypothetical protein